MILLNDKCNNECGKTSQNVTENSSMVTYRKETKKGPFMDDEWFF